MQRPLAICQALGTLAIGAALGTGACSRSETPEQVIRVAAASDLAGTLEELGIRFERKTGTRVSER